MNKRKHKFNVRDRIRELLPSDSRRRVITLLVILLALPVVLYLVQIVAKYRSDAQVAPVTLYFSPSTQSLPPQSQFKVMLNAGTQKVAFVRAVFTFDTTKLQVTSEIQPNAQLGTVIGKTTMANANTNGRIIIVLGLTPQDRANPPSGIFEIANFTVNAKSTTTNDTASFSFTTSDLQVVDINTNELAVNTQNATLTLNPGSVTPTPQGTVQINFQPAGSTVPAGYLVDSGAVYGSRNGQNYGWNADNSANTRERNSSNAPDQRYDTFIHLQEISSFTWEIAVPNGAYEVFAVAGEPLYNDQVNNLNFEGKVVNDPDGQDYFDEYTVQVTVSDGRLTIKPAANAVNAKLAFLHLKPITATSTPTQTITNTPTNTVTNTPTVIITNTPTSTLTNTPTNTVTNTPTNTVTATITNTPTNTGGPTPTPIPGDINGDNKVNILDYSILFAAFGTEPPSDPRADLNNDNRVNILDYSILFANFGKEL